MPDAGIKYPELDQGGRFAVWRNFFELAGCRVGSSDAEFDTLEDEVATIAPEDVQALSEKPFNGSFFLPKLNPLTTLAQVGPSRTSFARPRPSHFHREYRSCAFCGRRLTGAQGRAAPDSPRANRRARPGEVFDGIRDQVRNDVCAASRPCIRISKYSEMSLPYAADYRDLEVHDRDVCRSCIARQAFKLAALR
jgi:hypothetical protein